MNKLKGSIWRFQGFIGQKLLNKEGKFSFMMQANFNPEGNEKMIAVIEEEYKDPILEDLEDFIIKERMRNCDL